MTLTVELMERLSQIKARLFKAEEKPKFLPVSSRTYIEDVRYLLKELERMWKIADNAIADIMAMEKDMPNKTGCYYCKFYNSEGKSDCISEPCFVWRGPRY